MVVCRFFQQGYCRYGGGCRNDHIHPSKYNYHASQANAPPSVPIHSTEQLLTAVVTEVNVALNSGQWPFSCYAPFKGKSNFPGFIDFSPEEIRYNTYQTQNSGNLTDYLNLVKVAEEVYRRNFRQFLNPSNVLIRVLQSMNEGRSVQSPFDTNITENYLSTPTGTYCNNANTNGFVNVFQTTNNFSNPTDNIFSSSSMIPFSNSQGSNNIFGAQSAFQTSSPTNNSSASSIFAAANANIEIGNNNYQTISPSVQTSANVFAQTPAQSAANGFAQPNLQSTTSAFIQPTSPQTAASVFAQGTAANIFAQASVPNQSNNSNTIFASPIQPPPPAYQNPFEMPKTQQDNPFLSNSMFGFKQVDDPKELEGIVYSKIEQLTDEEIKTFQSDCFKQGRIPEIAPPIHLCQ